MHRHGFDLTIFYYYVHNVPAALQLTMCKDKTNFLDNTTRCFMFKGPNTKALQEHRHKQDKETPSLTHLQGQQRFVARATPHFTLSHCLLSRVSSNLTPSFCDESDSTEMCSNGKAMKVFTLASLQQFLSQFKRQELQFHRPFNG